jgi:DNA-binding XRE family transcriptional regulator
VNKLKEIRIKEKEMSQWRLSQISRVHQSRISLLENDLVVATKDEKEKLAEALRFSVEEIFPETQANASANATAKK